jgi:hypothetical protein
MVLLKPIVSPFSSRITLALQVCTGTTCLNRQAAGALATGVDMLSAKPVMALYTDFAIRQANAFFTCLAGEQAVFTKHPLAYGTSRASAE